MNPDTMPAIPTLIMSAILCAALAVIAWKDRRP